MEPLHKHPKMVIHSDEPLNAGAPLATLRQTYVTPQEYFFVRNHGTIPVVDITIYCLSVTGMVERPLELSLEDLKAMPATTEIALLQCAGIRRAEMAQVKPIPHELSWGADPIGNAQWRGVSLSTVLDEAGVQDGAYHIAFKGLDEVWRYGEQVGFGGSIPLEKVADVLLAYEMNGEMLPATHGFPLRVIVPGYIGARSVKWLSNINVQEAPSTNYFQAHAYKLFPPHIDAQNVDWNNGEMLGELSLNAVICQPTEGAICQAGHMIVQGYAVSQHGVPIERIELSYDEGKSWQGAALLEHREWSWCFWEILLDLPVGPCELIVRAWDVLQRTQPEAIEQVWNFKGYMNNAWHRVHIMIQDE